jgi:hypothetical protein
MRKGPTVLVQSDTIAERIRKVKIVVDNMTFEDPKRIIVVWI